MLKTENEYRKEFFDIARQIEKHHNLFYAMWSKGVPEWDSSIPTACVKFDKNTLYPLKFIFNPEFWDQCDLYKRAFIISHECLHILLRHGTRAKDIFNNENMEAINISTDIAINHILVNSFGFDREKIEGWEKYCWVDTVFEDRIVNDSLSFEQYLRELKSEGVGNKCSNCGTVDVHSFCDHDESDNLIASQIEEFINDVIAPHMEDIESLNQKIKQDAGDESGIFKKVEYREYVAPSRKWENIIKKWKRKGSSLADDSCKWTKVNRIYSSLPEDFCLPSDSDGEDFSPNRINIALFMDISGSCANYIDYFLRACRSIPKKRFTMNTYVFDTSVYKIDIDNYKPKVGGGTSFHVIQSEVEKLTSSGKKIDKIFVITDGGATHSDKYLNITNWHWFLVEETSKYNRDKIPHECKIHDLSDYFSRQLSV
jgi:predicted metal-dependent peptidase